MSFVMRLFNFSIQNTQGFGFFWGGFVFFFSISFLRNSSRPPPRVRGVLAFIMDLQGLRERQ